MSERSPSIGEPAPELELPDLGGDIVRLGDLAGQPLLVVFLRHAG